MCNDLQWFAVGWTLQHSHLALVQVADDLLEKPLLQLLLRPHVLAIPGDEVGRAGFVRPLGGAAEQHRKWVWGVYKLDLLGVFFFRFL